MFRSVGFADWFVDLKNIQPEIRPKTVLKIN